MLNNLIFNVFKRFSFQFYVLHWTPHLDSGRCIFTSLHQLKNTRIQHVRRRSCDIHIPSSILWIFYSFLLVRCAISCWCDMCVPLRYNINLAKGIGQLGLRHTFYTFLSYYFDTVCWLFIQFMPLSTMNHQPWQTDLSAGCRLDELLIDFLGFPAKVIRWGRLKVFTFEPELNVFIAELRSQEGAERC